MLLLLVKNSIYKFIIYYDVLLLMNKFIIILKLSLTFGTSINPNNLLDSLTSAINQGNIKSNFEQSIVTSAQIKHTFKFEYFYESETGNILVKYDDFVFLSNDNNKNFWITLPKLSKVRKLLDDSIVQKVKGSDFTFEDFLEFKNLKEKNFVDSKFSKERNNYLLILRAKPDFISMYSKKEIYINKLSFLPDRVYYYKDDQHIKTLIVTFKDGPNNLVVYDQLKMINHIDYSESIIKNLSTDYVYKFHKDIFNEKKLIK